MAPQEELTRCGYCSVPVESYERTETVLIVNGIREFGPSNIVIHPCGCIINFPEFAVVDELVYDETEDSQGEVHFIVAIWDKFNEDTTALQFIDVVPMDLYGAEDDD